MTSTTAIGWPDLVALKGEYVLAIEVKATKGVVGPQQIEWLERFAAIPTGLAWLLSPKADWQSVINWMHDPSKAPKIHGFVPSSPLTFTESPPATKGSHHHGE
jgi:Holliday junction resolvase